jgi:magnesium-transporting ATPase (P-type)
MMGTIKRAARWVARQSASLLLIVTATGLAAGGVASLAGAAAAADAAWLAAAACGLGYALWAAADAIRRGRLGVDVIALLALAGAIAVRELLAAAVISLMLTSGRTLEAWAARRATHDLSALLDRAPRTARRCRADQVQTVPLEDVVAGDMLLVASGDVVPVDGTVAGTVAVLDEAALMGLSRERIRQRQERAVDQMRSAAARPGHDSARGQARDRLTALVTGEDGALDNGLVRAVAALGFPQVDRTLAAQVIAAATGTRLHKRDSDPGTSEDG